MQRLLRRFLKAGPGLKTWRVLARPFGGCKRGCRQGSGVLAERWYLTRTPRGELGCARWTAEHDDCRDTKITRDAQEWQVSWGETFGAWCGCLAAFWCQSSIRYRGKVAGERGDRAADGSCVDVTGHAVTNELGEEIVAAGGGRGKFEGV